MAVVTGAPWYLLAGVLGSLIAVAVWPLTLAGLWLREWDRRRSLREADQLELERLHGEIADSRSIADESEDCVR